MIIAIDFDGTVVTHEYPSVGKDVGAVSVLEDLIYNGHLQSVRPEKKTLPFLASYIRLPPMKTLY